MFLEKCEIPTEPNNDLTLPTYTKERMKHFVEEAVVA